MAVLLSLCGEKEMYGYPLRRIVGMKQEDVYQYLHGMVKREILAVADDSMHIKEPWRTIVQKIIEAEKLIVCEDSQGRYEERFLYISDCTIVVFAQGISGEILQIELLDNETVAAYILEHGMRIASFLKGDGEEVELQPDESTELLFWAKRVFSQALSATLKDSSVLSTIAYFNKSKREKQKQIAIVHQVIEDYVIEISQEESNLFRYSEVGLKFLIDRWIGGNA